MELRALLRDQLFDFVMLISLERAFQCFGSDACLDSDVLPLKQSDIQLNTGVFKAVCKHI